MVRFIVDTQLPPVLATFLRRKGFDALHTTDFPKANKLSDAQIRGIASEEGRIVITKDDDFADYFWNKGTPPEILLLTIGNIKNNDLIDLFDLNLSIIVNLFESEAGMVVFGRNRIVAY